MRLVLHAVFLAVLAAADGPTCNNPLHIGEIRNYKNRAACLDIEGNDGVGQLYFGPCDGGKDQVFIFCEDGSLRNSAINNCVRYEIQQDHTITGPLHSQPCQFNADDTVHNINRWSMVNGRWAKDDYGISQWFFSLMPYNYHMWDLTMRVDENGYSEPQGDVYMRQDHSAEEQFWYFASKGPQVGFGRLVNWQGESQAQILDVEGNTGIGRVATYDAEGGLLDQVWAHYTNGDIISQMSFQCLDIEGNSGTGKVGIAPCGYGPTSGDDQKWTTSRQNNGEWFPVVNKKLEGNGDPCLTPENDDAYQRYVNAYNCAWQKPQYWKWDDNINWSRPQGEYREVGCNMSGSLKLSVTVSTEYSEEVTEEVTVELGMTISAGFDFMGTEVSESVAMSTSNSWSSTSGQSTTVEVQCKIYDNGESFTRGCMWQFQLESSKGGGNKLVWNPLMTRCTPDQTMPKCPPFEECIDEQCTGCQKLNQQGPQQSLEEGDKGVPKPLAGKAKDLQDVYPKRGLSPARKELENQRKRDLANALEVTKPRDPEMYRHEKPCKLVVDADECRGRGDCKTFMAGNRRLRRFKKCKPLKCKNIKKGVDCFKAQRGCHTFIQGRKLVRCRRGDRND